MGECNPGSQYQTTARLKRNRFSSPLELAEQ